jgi:hypothetical protein
MAMLLVTLDPRDAEYIQTSRADTSVKPRILVERVLVRATAETLIAAGYTLRLNDGEGWASPKDANVAQIMDGCMSTDEDTLHVYTTGGQRQHFGWVRFIYGNDGWDVIADHTTNLEEVLKPVNDFAETLSEGALFVVQALADPLRAELLAVARALTLATEEGGDKAMGTHYLANDNFIRCKGSFLELIEKARAAVAKAEGGAT